MVEEERNLRKDNEIEENETKKKVQEGVNMWREGHQQKLKSRMESEEN
jgi:hypothetical protein